MSYKEKIDDIISHRKGIGIYADCGHLNFVKEKLEFYKGLLKELEDFEMFRNHIMEQIENCQGSHYMMSIEDPLYLQHVQDASPENVIGKVKACIGELQNLESRFNRDTINISVIGRAGQGKSRLLQSISGLENEIIPADKGGDCTGAKSVICNAEGPLHAIVNFLSAKELMEQVQKYLEALDVKFEIGSISDIPNIDTGRIDVGVSNKKSSQLKHLKKYVEHFSEYVSYLGQKIELHDKNEIRKYASQYLEDETKVFYYLGVKDVQIFTEFPYNEAGKIMLVDTIGLGDTAIGLRDKLVETMVNDSDAAILLRRPDNLRDGIREEDDELYDMINQKMDGRAIEKWLFYVLNIFGDNRKSGEELYQQLNEKLGKTLKTAFIQKVDCANEEEVEERLLKPMLDFLSENLAEVDANLLASANSKCKDAYEAYFDLFCKIDAVVSESSFTNQEEEDKFDSIYEDELKLSVRIKKLAQKYSTRDVPCDELRDEIKKVLKTMKSHIPAKEEICSRLELGGQDGLPIEVYHFFISNVRTSIRNDFEKVGNHVVGRLEDEIKGEIINILKSSDGGMLQNVPLQQTDADTPIAWLEALVDQKTKDYPRVQSALNDVLNYKMNIEGLLGYYVNNALDCIDCEYNRPEYLEPDFTNIDAENVSEVICQSIQNALPVIASRVCEQIEETLLKIPYNSYCALVRKFYDNLLYDKEGKRNLKNFYRKNKRMIWKDVFLGLVSRNEEMKKWELYNNSMARFKESKLFIISF